MTVALGDRQAFGDQGQAARARKGLQTFRQQALGGKALADHAVEVPRGLHLHAGGNLFREKFDQQLGHVQAFTVSASDFTALPPSFSTQASAHILVRSRMRPM